MAGRTARPAARCAAGPAGDLRRQQPHPRVLRTAWPRRATRRSRRACSTGYAAASSSVTGGRPAGRGRLPQQLAPETALKDVAAAAAVVRNSGRVGCVGYCWGGTLAYLAACELPLACAVVYYGKVAAYLDRKPRCPVMYHFGADDKSIPPAEVEQTRAAAAAPDDGLHATRAPATASTASSVTAITRRLQRWRARVPSSSSPATSRGTAAADG